MKIVNLQVENIKKLVAVDITPDGNLVQITGKNGQGKTSVLDSIYWALAGASSVQSAPIRNGEESARIRLDLGEVIITRSFKGDKSTITVESADGARFGSPQTLIDQLVGSLSLDPLAFARSPAKSQFETLKKFVPGVDFAKIEHEQKADFDLRRDINRQIKEGEAVLSSMPKGVAGAVIDEDQIHYEVNMFAEQNNATVARAEKRNQLASEVIRLRSEAEAMLALAKSHEEKLKSAPPLPAIVDITEIQKKAQAASAHNKAVADRLRFEGHSEKISALMYRVDSINERMNQRSNVKAEAIRSAKLPTTGLGFGEDCVTLNGVPFDQASDAEQLRASISIAMAMNPKLRVIRVRDGSLLDEDAMKLLGDIATAEDFQVWIERVDGSGKVGFVLEDGHIKKGSEE